MRWYEYLGWGSIILLLIAVALFLFLPIIIALIAKWGK